jgi:hypothetical protein
VAERVYGLPNTPNTWQSKVDTMRQLVELRQLRPHRLWSDALIATALPMAITLACALDSKEHKMVLTMTSPVAETFRRASQSDVRVPGLLGKRVFRLVQWCKGKEVVPLEGGRYLVTRQ